MGLLLLIIAGIMKWILAPVTYTYCSIIALTKGEWNSYNKKLALAKDQYGNALGKYLFDSILIKASGYKFGNQDETISSVLGKNERDHTLTYTGLFIADTLNIIEKDHCKNSIDNTVGN